MSPLSKMLQQLSHDDLIELLMEVAVDSIEIINTANSKTGDAYKLNSIPGIRSRMRGYEHEIGEVEHEVRNSFDAIKKDIGAKNNNEAMKVMLEVCVRNPDAMRSIKEDMDKMEESERRVEIVTTP